MHSKGSNPVGPCEARLTGTNRDDTFRDQAQSRIWWGCARTLGAGKTLDAPFGEALYSKRRRHP
jgi:hypothetical protein